VRIRVFTDPEKLAEAAAEEIAGWLRIDHPNPTIGLAGGGTPRLTYRALRGQGVPWAGVHAWMTDERHVPPSHEDNNGRMARAHLLDHVGATFHAVPWHEDPARAAVRYEADLATFLPTNLGGLQPGLVLLGVGEDGHTASLFPGSPALEETRRGFVANWVAEQAAWRLTATLPLLLAARRTMFLATGPSKAAIAAQVLEGDTDLPAAVVTREARDAVWLLDKDAAAHLSLNGTQG
jgi:6-phosphogluconolactonase